MSYFGDGTYEAQQPLPCGHTRMRPVYAYSPVAGRVAIDHYTCADCPDSTETCPQMSVSG
jgi:hypothetical protein